MEERELRLDHNTLSAAQRAYRKALEPVCLEWRLTQTELDVLLFLRNNPQYDRAADVAEHRGLQKSHVSLSVGNLILRGMLEKHPDPMDKRSVRLVITRQGIEAAQAGRLAQKRFFGQLSDGISEEDLEHFRRTVQKILRNIESIDWL